MGRITKSVGGALIDSGPITATSKLDEVPEQNWYNLMCQREMFVKAHLPEDCRRLIQFVEDAERMFAPLGFKDANDFIERGLKLVPEEIRIAVDWLKINRPEQAVAFDVVLGKHGGRRAGLSAMTPENYNSDRLYCNITQYAKGVLTDVRIFADCLYLFIRDRLWEKGWYDRIEQKLKYAPSLTEFLNNPVPRGAGTSVPWVHGVLRGPAELRDKAAINALKALDDELRNEGWVEQYPSAAAFKREVAERIEPIGKQGRPKKDEDKGANGTFNKKGSNKAAYLIARLKRDFPEIAKRLGAGEFRSVRAAAIAAGLIAEPTPFEQIEKPLRKFGPQLSPDELQRLRMTIDELTATLASRAT
jgi:hypothetical protein